MKNIIIATIIGTVIGTTLSNMFPGLFSFLNSEFISKIPLMNKIVILVVALSISFVTLVMVSDTDRWKRYFKAWEKYKKDKFCGMTCRWDWKNNKIENVSFYCPLCDKKLENDTLENDRNKEYTIA